MAIKQMLVERLSLVSLRAFADAAATIEAAVGHPDMRAFGKSVAEAKTKADLERVVDGAIGPSGFMEFMRVNHGQFLDRVRGQGTSRMVRFIVGNPLIMMQMAKHVPDTGSYAPVTVLIDEREDGVHLSYDKMASFLAPYGNLAAQQVAEDLDAKVETLLRAAAG